jgi:hypothetical protein
VLAARYRGRGMIFALHSVVEDGAVHPDYTLRCSVGQLTWTLAVDSTRVVRVR